MIHLEKAIRLLAESKVAFVIVGGVAATIHGSAQATFDLDLCYGRDDENLRRLVNALAPQHPRLRGAPEHLPFLWDTQTLRRGLNYTLVTDMGELDLLGEIAGVGDYVQALAASVPVRLFTVTCAVLSLPALIAARRAAGRPRDINSLPELEALLEATREQREE